MLRAMGSRASIGAAIILSLSLVAPGVQEA